MCKQRNQAIEFTIMKRSMCLTQSKWRFQGTKPCPAAGSNAVKSCVLFATVILPFLLPSACQSGALPLSYKPSFWVILSNSSQSSECDKPSHFNISSEVNGGGFFLSFKLAVHFFFFSILVFIKVFFFFEFEGHRCKYING